MLQKVTTASSVTNHQQVGTNISAKRCRPPTRPHCALTQKNYNMKSLHAFSHVPKYIQCLFTQILQDKGYG